MSQEIKEACTFVTIKRLCVRAKVVAEGGQVKGYERMNVTITFQ